MSRASYRAGVGLFVVLALGLGYAAWTLLGTHDAAACHACGRMVHIESRTLARVDGEVNNYCCLTCALTHHQQSGLGVEVVELRNYETGEPLDPATAYIVRESDVNLCTRHGLLADREGVSEMEFDRCSPSMLAFVDFRSAEQFRREHGGIVLPFAEVEAAFEAR